MASDLTLQADEETLVRANDEPVNFKANRDASRLSNHRVKLDLDDVRLCP